ncbi:regulatory protein GemA [Parasedimentitalea marina]|uniref:Regulatory protein GemA n=1 Tax=Parasedimentitalea marina TaxID=2483033 RepID=A0A3T0N1G8_9RHOB|nr:regulatory protein GemA [Parasedimentitalea marina]AZV77855.1 regulatory protein GemA [Parasedimentitalea marina]
MTRALQQKIHVGCRELGLDGDARRALQLVVTGKKSMKDMDDTDLLKVLKRLKKDGFNASSKGAKKHKVASRPDLRLVHVLWTKLGEAGELRDPSRAGLNKFVRDQFGNIWGSVPADIDMLRDHKQINAVIQALKAWGARAGIDFNWAEHRK